MSFFKKVFKSVGSMLGISESPAQEKARKQAEAQAREMENMQKQRQILDNANELSEVTTIQEGLLDDGGSDTSTGTRRKKQATGGATSGLGITI